MYPGWGREVLLYVGYVGMCGRVFSAVLVINSVSTLADFAGHFGQKLGYVFCTLALIWIRSHFFIIIEKKINISSSQIYHGTNCNAGLKQGFDARVRS